MTDQFPPSNLLTQDGTTEHTFLKLLHSHGSNRYRIRLRITSIEWNLGFRCVSTHSRTRLISSTVLKPKSSGGWHKRKKVIVAPNVLFELIERSCSERIGADETRPESFPLIMDSQLA